MKLFILIKENTWISKTYLFDLLFVAAEEKKPDIIEAMKFGMLDMVMILNF